MNQRIAVVGGGVTGLAACYELECLGFTNITLFEADRIGGKLQTHVSDGFVIEEGPDSIFLRGPSMAQYIEELGLTERVIEPVAKGFSIWIDGALREIPPGLTRLGSIDQAALEAFPHLTPLGKTQALAEATVPPNLEEDESIAGFFRRRFGREYAMKIAEPLFAGTHGGGAEELSMQALYPSYRQTEREHGSLSAASKSGQTTGIAKFISFQGGCQTLPNRMCQRLEKTQIIPQKFDSVDGFDGIILAISSLNASELFQASDPPISALLKSIPSSSSAIVTLKFNERLYLKGAGFLVPESDPIEISGATWSSQKWAHRAPEAQTLIRVFVHASETDENSILKRARTGLENTIALTAKPSHESVTRWPNGLPQYKLGHLDLVTEIEQTLRAKGRIFVAGQSYRGVGIPDCIRQGRDAATALAASWV